MLPDTVRRRQFVTALGVGGLTIAGTGLASADGRERGFRTHLSGDEEVPPVETRAQGQANFRLSTSGDELRFEVVVANIEDVVAAHVHCAPSGQNGPVGVTLFSGGPTSENGILAEGTITAPDPGNGCGWATIDDVVDAMQSGESYVNVHTVANPGGEIRGQVR